MKESNDRGNQMTGLNSWDERAYRAALGRFATGVTVVTATDAAGITHGLTVNSFTSVSLTPPLVLWCLGNDSDAYALFANTSTYGVSILMADDEARAMRFAGKGDQTLIEEEIQLGNHGVSLLRGALATLECRVTERFEAGDHLILLAKTLAYDSRDGDGLSYFQGTFGAAKAPVSLGSR